MNSLTALCLVLLAVIALAAYRLRGSSPPAQSETPTLARVKRRHELHATLQNLVGCDLEAGRLIQAEAKRLQMPRSSLEVLEAAITRAQAEQTLERR